MKRRAFDSLIYSLPPHTLSCLWLSWVYMEGDICLQMVFLVTCRETEFLFPKFSNLSWLLMRDLFLICIACPEFNVLLFHFWDASWTGAREDISGAKDKHTWPCLPSESRLELRLGMFRGAWWNVNVCSGLNCSAACWSVPPQQICPTSQMLPGNIPRCCNSEGGLGVQPSLWWHWLYGTSSQWSYAWAPPC